MAHRDILHRVTNPVVAEVGMQRLLQNTTVRDPEQKSAVVGFGRNGIQVITGRPWRSTTDKRRFAWGNCRPSPGAGHGVLRAAPAGARAADHQGPFRPLAPKAPASRQWRPNRRIFEDAASDRASNLRSAAQVCTAIRSTIGLSLAARPLADHLKERCPGVDPHDPRRSPCS